MPLSLSLSTRYAISWQHSIACQLTGFLGVFSSELSVYTLVVITCERYYAITHAMHLNKRLSRKHATYIMSIGWTFAIIMAFLPLIGISDYRKFAVCLPFEISNFTSMAYVITLIAINGIAFFILMACYLRMYCEIRGSQAWNSNDSRIAKRMALLVFTDFLCWAPIAFFTFTALSGLELISLNGAKIFTVFILPLNACANPFLYAIFTKQFKKECFTLFKRLQETHLSRGFVRGHNSSNISNRHTPLNTNSEKRNSADKSSPKICANCSAPCKRNCQAFNFDQIKHSIQLFDAHNNAHLEKHLCRLNSFDIECGHEMDKNYHFKSTATDRRQIVKINSLESTSASGSLPPDLRKRLDSSSSGGGNHSSRSRKQSAASARLIELKRSLPVSQRRSSWTGSASTSTFMASTNTTRSSVSSDTSFGMVKYDYNRMNNNMHNMMRDEIVQSKQMGNKNDDNNAFIRRGYLCRKCTQKGINKMANDNDDDGDDDNVNQEN